MNHYDTEKLILTDCDGVLLNWEYAFDIWMKNRGYKASNDHQLKFQYGIQHRYNLTEDQKESLVREFNASAAMGFLPPLRDAIQYVTKLHREHGYVFHCITSMSNDKNAQKLRIMNLNKIFGDTVFEEYIFLDCGADKTEVLSKYKNTDLLWVEDKLENAIVGKNLGLNSILMKHGHNMIRSNLDENDPIREEGKYIFRFKNWKDIYRYIIGE